MVPRLRRGKTILSPLFTWRSGFASPISDLRPSRRHVAHVLALHMTKVGDNCFVSIPTIAAETGYCVRTIYYAIAELVEHGWVEKESRPGRTNLYRAAVPSWWVAAASEHGLDVLATLDEGGSAAPSTDAPPSSSAAAEERAIGRAHRWLENVGWGYDERIVREELAGIVGDGAAARLVVEVLLTRWRELKHARDGPLADAA
jgi:hypothetical protein